MLLARKEGISLIRNVNKLLRTKKKKPPLQKIPEDLKPQDVLQDHYDQNVETFRAIYQNCSDVMFRSVYFLGKRKR